PPKEVFTFPIGFSWHRVNGRLDLPPEFVIQKPRDAWLGFALPLPGKGQRIARQVTRIDQPRKQSIQDHDRLALTGGRQRTSKGTPVRFKSRPFAASFHNPALGG